MPIPQASRPMVEYRRWNGPGSSGRFAGMTSDAWASWHVQNGTPLQELMELGSWASDEMVLRYAHLAADHLRGAACPIDDTLTTHMKNPQLGRAA